MTTSEEPPSNKSTTHLEGSGIHDSEDQNSTNEKISDPNAKSHKSFWLWVMCLTGVDYFSTLAYQPSIAYENAGILAPFATIVLVLVTLFGALPIYRYVAKQSHEGQGSIGMLAQLVSGWVGKILVLILLGFAATDFVITKTLSAADAAEHLIHNPLFHIEGSHPSEEIHIRIVATCFLLVLLGAMFLRGFREVIMLAVFLVFTYLVLNALIIGSGLIYIANHPETVQHWLELIREGKFYVEGISIQSTDLLSIVLICLIIFPKLALGLSGFETGVAMMPLIRGKENEGEKDPSGRISNTHRLLVTAAVIMSIYLLTSSLVVAVLIEPQDILSLDSQGNRVAASAPTVAGEQGAAESNTKKPMAANRAIAFLCHGEGKIRVASFCGPIFGTIYDLVTVVILWFAGASAMAGLLNLVPKYLPRYGMAPEWARANRPLIILFTFINLIVTLIFSASVDDQGNAYATGVLMLITSACIASVIHRIQHSGKRSLIQRIPWGFALITLIFFYTTGAVVIEKPEGIKIAGFFIATILATSFYSRFRRSRELRFSGFLPIDAESKLYWDTIKHLEISVLVPHRPGNTSLNQKEIMIRREHRIPRDLPMVFVEVELSDASEFIQEPLLAIREEGGRFIMKISRAASIAHTLVAVALEMAKVGRPPEIHFGWTKDSVLSGTLGFLIFGEGNVPWMVRDLIVRAEPNPEKRPLIVVAGV